MFDMKLWDRYLSEWRFTARKEGASSLDITELLLLSLQREVVIAKAEALQSVNRRE
jgi:hypothetical protein